MSHGSKPYRFVKLGIYTVNLAQVTYAGDYLIYTLEGGRSRPIVAGFVVGLSSGKELIFDGEDADKVREFFASKGAGRGAEHSPVGP